MRTANAWMQSGLRKERSADLPNRSTLAEWLGGRGDVGLGAAQQNIRVNKNTH